MVRVHQNALRFIFHFLLLAGCSTPPEPCLVTGGFEQFDDLPAVGEFPVALTSTDLDGDGDIDLAIANRVSGDVSLLLNRGDGSFNDAETIPVGERPAWIAAARLGGDIAPTLFVSNQRSDTISLLQRNSEGIFVVAQTLEGFRSPHRIALSDLDGDGDLDLAVGSRGLLEQSDDSAFGGTRNIGDTTLDVLLNEGDGSFSGPRSNFLPGPTKSVVAGDFDGDGDVDIVVGSLGRFGDRALLLTNRGDASFRAAHVLELENHADLTAGDFDDDGDLDLVVVSGIASPPAIATVLSNDGAGNFGVAATIKVGQHPFNVVAGDLNSDGSLDLVVTNIGLPHDWRSNIAVLLNRGNHSFELMGKFCGGKAARVSVLTDLDGDGDLDVSSVNAGSNAVTLHRNGIR